MIEEIKVSEDITITKYYVENRVISFSIDSKTGAAVTDGPSGRGFLAIDNDELPALIEKLTEIQKEIENETDGTER